MRDRATVLDEAEDAITRSVAIMHEHARKVLETAELVLGRVSDRLQNAGGNEASLSETNAFLAKLKAPLAQAVAIWIADEQGTIQAASQDWNHALPGIADRDFFQVQRDHDAGTYIGSAFRGKATSRATFAVSQRRPSADGHFAGTIHIGLDPEYFARFYSEAAPDLPHTGALVRDDGEVLIREPYRPSNLRLGPDNPMMKEITIHPDGGFSSAPSSVDGAERLYAYRKVAGYPLYVVMGVSKSVALQHWQAHLAGFAAVAGPAWLALLLLSWLALRGARSEQATTLRLQSALEELRTQTARRETAEDRVRQAQRMEAVGQLTAGIAHDFNNLLTAVLGSLDLLRKRLTPGDEKAARLLSTAEKGAQRGAALTQRLLAFGRGQALRPVAVDVGSLVEGMLELLGDSLDGTIQIEKHFPAVMPPALVDAAQLEVALLNLAVNARDAMPKGGLLTISGREEQAGADGELLPGGYVVLRVADTGEGMDSATLARCVEPFFTTKGVGKGTGLGLSMVHGLAAQSQGKITLQSQLGVGTAVELWLPQATTSSAEPSVPGAAGPLAPSLRRCTILVVDDDPLVLASIGSMVEDLGHASVEASSGHQALDIIRTTSKLDLILTDHSMPGMTGLQLAHEARQLRPNLPMLLASGYADSAELVELRHALPLQTF